MRKWLKNMIREIVIEIMQEDFPEDAMKMTRSANRTISDNEKYLLRKRER